MSIIAKECLVGYFDETGEYEERELKENKEYIFKDYCFDKKGGFDA